MLKWLEEVSDNFKGWVLNNGTNPFFWVILFFLGLLVFAVTYRALTKHSQ